MTPLMRLVWGLYKAKTGAEISPLPVPTKKEIDMLYIKLKKITSLALVAFLLSSILFATNSYADTGLFADLIKKGAELFEGMRDIIFAVSGFGIIAIAVGGLFGNFNWKWLGAIIIGLMVIAGTSGIVEYMTGQGLQDVQDTLK